MATTSPTVITAPTDGLARLGDALAAGWRALDAWLAERRRVAQDRADLSGMSDRELSDIGVHRASVDAVADGGWSRDTFC
jgi:uncharacterized protein YjiS (DUF1127 family)